MLVHESRGQIHRRSRRLQHLMIPPVLRPLKRAHYGQILQVPSHNLRLCLGEPLRCFFSGERLCGHQLLEGTPI
jgi:hypothetical protein